MGPGAGGQKDARHLTPLRAGLEEVFGAVSAARELARDLALVAESEAHRRALAAALPATAPPAARRLPACRHWPAALAGAPEAGPVGRLVEVLQSIEPRLRWVQNPNYRDPAYLENYCYAELVGPSGLLGHGGVLIGIMLLGPDNLYAAHAHPAVELYIPLSGTAAWWREDRGPAWRVLPPGSVIHHPAGVVHAVRPGAEPLLVLYAWRGDITTRASLV